MGMVEVSDAGKDEQMLLSAIVIPKVNSSRRY
jgi:hypothetical protein